MSYLRRILLRALPVAGLTTVLLSACMQMQLPEGVWHEKPCQPGERVCREASVMALAKDLDHLEGHIEKYGSVTAMQPSVWGEARLTAHRHEFEKIMAERRDKFQPTLQGSLARSDQAYLATAMTLGVAVSGRQAGARPPRGAAAAAATTTIEVPDAAIQKGTFVTFSDKDRSPAALPDLPGFRNLATPEGAVGALALEPTIDLNQRARYLNHLHELRRINEGDDTADSPGYALNLVRIPVSVLPGKCTREGHGAEITMTIKPYLSEALLPTTFRNLVINDLLTQIGVPLTEYINDPDNDWLIPVIKKQREIEATALAVDLAPVDPAAPAAGNPPAPRAAETALAQAVRDLPAPAQVRLAQSFRRAAHRPGAALRGAPSVSPAPEATLTVDQQINHARAAVQRQQEKLRSRTVPTTKVRRAGLPFAPSQMLEVYGAALAQEVALQAYERLTASAANTGPCEPNQVFVHLPTVQGYLHEELVAAHRFLADPANAALWEFCTPELVHLVRARRLVELNDVRGRFLQAVGPHHRDAVTTMALAWAVIVESALLNDRLMQDMKEVAAARGCACPPGEWLPYFLPCPPAEARQAFNQYVECRWPIHVFALDPVTEQQNIADTFIRRRETQLALSLAFVSGNISARRMPNYARRLEADFQTIDLNNTAVGFSHGADTFGWRFYPRFQTPEVEGNFTVIARDLVLGGPTRDDDLRRRRLEPGQRECVAVVVMPSFVPYATVDVSSNYFALTNPKCKVMDTTYAMKLSKAVKTIETCGPGVADAECYRGGDSARLLAKAKQLEARLPLQSMTVQVPYENTLGGFAMFNTGITDLGPNLTGWYGAPSIDPAQDTTLFLIGDQFSVHQTRVAAGGADIAPLSIELLSRQVMRVTIPAGVRPQVTEGGRKFVPVHVATPYGITPPLLIPVCGEPEAPAPAAGPAWKTEQVELAFVYDGLGIAVAKEPSYRPTELVLTGLGDRPAEAKKANVTFTFDEFYQKRLRKLGLPTEFVMAGLLLDGDAVTIPANLFAASVFTVLGRAFGPEAINPPVPVVTSATVAYTNGADAPIPGPQRVSNTLTINWVKAPR